VTRGTALVARHTLAYGVGSIVGGITRATLLPIIARKLSAEEYGVLALLLATTNLLHLIFELGLVTALIRFHHDTEDSSERIALRSAVFAAMLILDLLLAVPLLLGRDVVSLLLFGSSAHGTLVAIAIATAFFAAQFQLLLGTLRSEDRSKDFAILMTIRGIVSLVTTILLVFVGQLAIAGFLLGNLAGPVAVSIVAIPRLLLRSKVHFQGAKPRARRVLAFGLPLVPSSLGLWALTHLDAWLLRVFADLRAVGIYGYGSELCLPIALAFLSFYLAWPSFAFARGRKMGGAEELARVFRHAFVGLVAMGLAVSVLRHEIVGWIATETYAGTTQVLPLLVLATLLYAASQVFGTGLQIRGDTRRLPLYVALATALNALLNVFLIPPLRERGAGVATIITNFALCVFVLRESNRQFAIPFEIGKLVRIVGTAWVILVAADFCGALPLASAFALRILLLGLFPFALVLSGGVSGSELRKLPALLGALGKSS
jgi:O-antigen/teichoic acid export membrane protein